MTPRRMAHRHIAPIRHFQLPLKNGCRRQFSAVRVAITSGRYSLIATGLSRLRNPCWTCVVVKISAHRAVPVITLPYRLTVGQVIPVRIGSDQFDGQLIRFRFRMGVIDISGIFLYVLMKAASRLAAQKRWGTHRLWTFFQDRRFSTLAGQGTDGFFYRFGLNFELQFVLMRPIIFSRYIHY